MQNRFEETAVPIEARSIAFDESLLHGLHRG
jgi:hypothetical protein